MNWTFGMPPTLMVSITCGNWLRTAWSVSRFTSTAIKVCRKCSNCHGAVQVKYPGLEAYAKCRG